MSFTLSPGVSGWFNSSLIVDSTIGTSGGFMFRVSGNTQLAGTLGVSGNTTVGGTLGVTGEYIDFVEGGINDN